MHFNQNNSVGWSLGLVAFVLGLLIADIYYGNISILIIIVLSTENKKGEKEKKVKVINLFLELSLSHQ